MNWRAGLVIAGQGSGQLPLLIGFLGPGFPVFVILRVAAVELAAGVPAADLFLAAFVVARIGAVFPAVLVGRVRLCQGSG